MMHNFLSCAAFIANLSATVVAMSNGQWMWAVLFSVFCAINMIYAISGIVEGAIKKAKGE